MNTIARRRSAAAQNSAESSSSAASPVGDQKIYRLVRASMASSHAQNGTDNDGAPCSQTKTAFIQNDVRPAIRNLFPGVSIMDAAELRSAQQHVFLISTSFDDPFTIQQPHDQNNPTTPEQLNITSDTNNRMKLRRELERGCGKLIARRWRNSARFWNLNTSSNTAEDILMIARAEVAGYRVARRLICDGGDGSKEKRDMIPQVLYFSHDISDVSDDANYAYQTEEIWGLFAYVGEGSASFRQTSRIHEGNFANQMVKVRHEFGFDEPHPRHGRVVEEHCLAYALKIIDQVIIPLHDCAHRQSSQGHSLIFSEREQVLLGVDGRSRRPFSFGYMLDLYEGASVKMGEHIISLQMNSNETNKLCGASQYRFDRLVGAIQSGSKELRGEVVATQTTVPFTLVHCDLQPQNLIFWRRDQTFDDFSEKTHSYVPNIACILDWEEAALADLRFELLLVCRKVCASMEQATSVWNYYREATLSRHQLDIGSLEPWLKLEGLHSITTMAMQALLGGGRGPWEKKSDLICKIDRELLRLVSLGMISCKSALSSGHGEQRA